LAGRNFDCGGAREPLSGSCGKRVGAGREIERHPAADHFQQVPFHQCDCGVGRVMRPFHLRFYESPQNGVKPGMRTTETQSFLGLALVREIVVRRVSSVFTFFQGF
jgi:hypothetical protein